MLIELLLVGIVVVFGTHGHERYEQIEVDYYAQNDCHSDYKCSISLPALTSRNVSLMVRRYKSIRVLYAKNDDPYQLSVWLSMKIHIVYTKKNVWFRDSSDSNYERFQSYKRVDFEPVQKLTNAKRLSFQSFEQCVQETTGHEINCNWLNTTLTNIPNLTVNKKLIPPRVTYLNLSGKKIGQFDSLPPELTTNVLRINLIGTEIGGDSKTFLHQFVAVRQLDLPDSLFSHNPVHLFERLTRLRMIVTPLAVYWRVPRSKSIERFDRRTRCFLTISADDETRTATGCLAAPWVWTGDNTNFDWMRNATLHTAAGHFAGEVAGGIFGILVLIAILSMCFDRK